LSVVIIVIDEPDLAADESAGAATDSLLRALSDLIRGQIRDNDVLARLGEAAFLLVLPSAIAEFAHGVADRLKAALEAERWPDRLVVSFGVATTAPATQSVDHLLSDAMVARRRSSQAGRNRAKHHEDTLNAIEAAGPVSTENPTETSKKAIEAEALERERAPALGDRCGACAPPTAQAEPKNGVWVADDSSVIGEFWAATESWMRASPARRTSNPPLLVASDRQEIDFVLDEPHSDLFDRMQTVAVPRPMQPNRDSARAPRRKEEIAYEQGSLSFDTVIEVWLHALELHDRQTESHSRRVSELTLRLAHRLGIDGAELVHVRRGALLHDIGKIGIPESILHKPGPLDEDEWCIMRQHPAYAREMLARTEFLRPAIDIPYCHHERWDGLGYPRGLVGEQIPLAARICAAVDIWDSLLSDRPYRRGWPCERVRKHVAALSGSHLDPRVVELLLREVARIE
jgi:diguanylate cyclase (GGDEF)-like protein/putative nucleotidyltransferase with HDIG domain